MTASRGEGMPVTQPRVVPLVPPAPDIPIPAMPTQVSEAPAMVPQPAMEEATGLPGIPLLDVTAQGLAGGTSAPLEESTALPTYQTLGGPEPSYPTYMIPPTQPTISAPSPSTVSSPPLAATTGGAPLPTTPTLPTQEPSQPQQGETVPGGRSSRNLPSEIATHPALVSLAQANNEVLQMMEYEQASVGPATTPAEPPSLGGTPGPAAPPTTTTPEGGKYVDITDYLNMPQTRVAKVLGIPSSTLSKRWREAARQRKWPWRTVCKIDKEIMALLHNIPSGINFKGTPEQIPGEIQTRLMSLLRQRQEELKPVVIRL
jgi:hypothetical protein